jgi:oligopeptide transport system substrate-binding protein
MLCNGGFQKKLLGLAVALFLSSTAHAEQVLYAVGGQFKGFDPIESGDVESAVACSRVYEGLMEYAYLKRPYVAIPRLAEAMPEVSADGLMYTFKIKRGVHFMDDPCFPDGKGREVTAADFVYSFKRLLNSTLESDGTWIFEGHVLGAEEWMKATAEANGPVDYSKPLPGFVAADRYTLQIKLSRPYPQLYWVLTMPYAFVVSHEAVEKYGEEFSSHPVGTGPFKLKSWRRNYRVEYVRNPQFSGQTYPTEGALGDKEAGLLEDAGKPLPLLDRIVNYDVEELYTAWQMFLTGQTCNSNISKDNFNKVITPSLMLTPELKKKGICLYKLPSMSVEYIGFNMRDKVVGTSKNAEENLRHKKLRQAVSCAIDVRKFITVIANDRGERATSPLPLGVSGHVDKPYPYDFDPERAKKLLAEAGYPGGKDAKGRQLRLSMIMPGAGNTDAKQMADFLTENLRNVGVDLAVTMLTFPEYLRREHTGETQVFWAGWVMDYPDGQNMLQLFYGPNQCPGVNSANYENPEFDRLYEKILSMPDSPERAALYTKMAEMVVDDCVWALVDYPIDFFLYHSWLRNYKPHDFPYANSKFYKVVEHGR